MLHFYLISYNNSKYCYAKYKLFASNSESQLLKLIKLYFRSCEDRSDYKVYLNNKVYFAFK